jgi:hypothetical protein
MEAVSHNVFVFAMKSLNAIVDIDTTNLPMLEANLIPFVKNPVSTIVN